jgi:hypothetical protein
MENNGSETKYLLAVFARMMFECLSIKVEAKKIRGMNKEQWQKVRPPVVHFETANCFCNPFFLFFIKLLLIYYFHETIVNILNSFLNNFGSLNSQFLSLCVSLVFFSRYFQKRQNKQHGFSRLLCCRNPGWWLLQVGNRQV